MQPTKSTHLAAPHDYIPFEEGKKSVGLDAINCSQIDCYIIHPSIIPVLPAVTWFHLRHLLMLLSNLSVWDLSACQTSASSEPCLILLEPLDLHGKGKQLQGNQAKCDATSICRKDLTCLNAALDCTVCASRCPTFFCDRKHDLQTYQCPFALQTTFFSPPMFSMITAEKYYPGGRKIPSSAGKKTRRLSPHIMSACTLRSLLLKTVLYVLEAAMRGVQLNGYKCVNHLTNVPAEWLLLQIQSSPTLLPSTQTLKQFLPAV